MAKKLTSAKAKEILHDKSVHGHPLTDKQRRFFGAIAGGAPVKAKTGGWLDNYGEEANANEGRSSASQDWIGEGYSNVGRNYSPAWGGQFAMGGSIPGSVGFTYARTQGAAPSNGPYAKKTKASAQNGQEMKFYQEGLDWKPKTISKNGGWLDKYIPEAQGGLNIPGVTDFKMPRLSNESTSLGTKIDEAAIRQAQIDRAREKQGTISKAEPKRSAASKALAIAINPVTALSYKVKGQDIPEHFDRGEQSAYDAALNIVNPAGYVDAAASIPGNISRGEFLQAGINAASLYPALAELRGAAPELRSAINASKESGLLSNAYKLNPWAFKANPEAYYRGIGKEGLDDILESGIVRSKKQNAYPEPYFSKGVIGDKYAKGYFAELTNEPMKGVGSFAEGDLIQTPVNTVGVNNPNLKLYKQDWLRGYKEVPKPTSTFQSEIDWGKWNSEILSNQALMQEYNTIEQTSKANGTWMKNPDGSAFQGTPEQFVQQNSQNFKKAFPEGYISSYRGSQSFDPTLSRSLRGNSNNHILFGTSDKATAEIYATNGGYNLDHLFKDVGKKPGFFHPDESVENIYTGMEEDVNPGMYQYALDKRLPTITAEGSGNHWHSIKNDEVLEWLKNNNPEYANNRIGFSKDPDLIRTDDVASYMIDKDIPIGISKNTIDSYNGIPSNIFMSNSKLARPKSLMYNNGMFDMTNPNIYKALIPALIGAGALEQKKKGGVIKDDMGQWAHPGEITEIQGNTMATHGYGDIPLYVIPDVGRPRIVQANTGTHTFPGATKFTEYPITQKVNQKETGGWLNQYK